MALILALRAVPALAWVPASALADNDDGHGRARRAVEAGRILPLSAILAHAQSAYPGQLIEAELDDDDDDDSGAPRMVYELKILTSDGRLMKLDYDAATGILLKAKGRKHHQ